MTFTQFVQAHQGWIAAVGIPLLITLLSTVASRFADPDDNPATPPPRWVRVVMTVVDVLSWIDRDGKLTLPGRPTAPAAPTLKLVDDRKDRGSARVEVVAGVSLFSFVMLVIFLVVMMLSNAGCITSATKPGDTTAQKLQQTTDAVKVIAKDVVDKCGPQFAPIMPLVVDALNVAKNPYDIAADIALAINAVTSGVADYHAIECVLRTISADYKTLFKNGGADAGAAPADMGETKPAAQLIYENADAVADLIASGAFAPADMACASR